MPTPHDEKFAEAALEQKLVSRDHIQKCLAEIKRSESFGQAIPLDALLVRKRLITREQADAVLNALTRKRALGRIGGFELMEEIGRGGMGTVYKARQISMDRMVALKVLPPHLAKNKAYIERFFKEARAVARLSHINIIQGYDVGEASGYYFFAMEFIDGESVAARLIRDGRVSEAESLNVVEQICRALAHAQSVAGIIHRDIKPDNIMITKSGMAKLADLGLAKSAGEGAAGDIAAGTPHYVSPEQARGQADVDTRSDIYSLGATLFHMVTGQPPFDGPTPEAIINLHATQEVPAPRGINAALSTNVCKLIATMMAKSPDDRYQSPDELLQDISLVKEGIPPQKGLKLGGTSTGASRAAARHRSSALPVTAVLISLVIIAGAAFAILNQPGSAPPVVDSPRDRFAKEAGRAYEDAAAAEKENPWKYAEIIQKFAMVGGKYADTPSGRQALQKVETLTRERIRNAESTFAKVKKEADELAAKEQYAKAVAAWNDNYPKRLVFDDWDGKVKAEVARINSKARSRLTELEARVQAEVEKGQFDDAIKMLQTGVAFGYKDVSERLNASIADVRKRAAEHARKLGYERKKSAQVKFSRLLADVVTLEQKRNYAAALNACEAYVKELGDSEESGAFADKARELQDEVQTADEIWNAGMAALRKLIGSPVEVRAKGIKLSGKLRKVSDATFVVETPANVITNNLSDVDPETWLWLAGVTTDDRYTVVRQAKFLLAVGALEKAKLAIVRLDDKALLKKWQDTINERKNIEGGQESTEAGDAEPVGPEAVDEAKTLARENRWRELYVKLAAIRRNIAQQDPGAGQVDAKEIDALVLQDEAGLCKELGIEGDPRGDFVRLLDTLREYARWQEENKCPKTIPCPACSPVASGDCSRCKGTGFITCPQCKGRKIEPVRTGVPGLTQLCSVCGGDGKVRCPVCNKAPDPRNKCELCKGTKSVVCPICKGTGFKAEVPAKFTEAVRELGQRYKLKLEAVAGMTSEK